MRIEYHPDWSWILKWAFAIGGIFALILGITLFWNRRLTREIDNRKRAQEALRESERQLSIRNRIAEIFLTTPNEEMYGEVLQVVLEAMDSPYGTFAYIDENGDRIVPSMTRDIWDECKMPDKGIFFPRDTWGDTLWARALIEKKSFSSNGPFKIPDGHMLISRALATPIIHKGESIGNLMVGDKPTDYSEKDKELLEAIADRIAPTLNARLLNERHDRERKLAEERVKTSLEEKEVLLREIHHRVKNNMQVITSLLRLQSDTINDQQYADMFRESQERIRSMALIHETLYQSEDFANIDFDGYLRTLINSLFISYGASPDKISLKIETNDLSLELDYAIPCGLIINELVSNSLKYAFPEDRKGEISVTLRSITENEVELTVSDNGIGIPDELDLGTIESVGLDLVKVLAEHQLEGKIELKRTGGTSFSIRFTVKTVKARI
ncbi:MAG: GAF domain-containing protein [Deltaproteobacteria bacterium]|nr:GAF domain-containing protein [Deltaproteobacteria bacterium]